MSAIRKEQDLCKKYLFCEGKVKGHKSENGPLIIEGFANRFSDGGKQLIDRGGDLIPPEAWVLDEFKSLPIIFFNHDRNQPVGKATMVNPTKDGLFIRVKISESDHPEIKRVRDLVKEGILKAFSVGFDPLEEETKDIDGKEANIITKANLLEVSIVSLPMAQQSLFEVTTKSLANMPFEDAVDLLTKQSDRDEDEDEEKPKNDKQPEEDDETSVEEEEKQEEEGEEAEDDSEEKDAFQDCVSDKIRKLRGEGVKPDEAVARAMAACREEGKSSCELNFEQLKDAFDLASSINDQKQDVPAPISSRADDSTDFGDPHLDVAKQTNVMLGQLIREIQIISQKLDGLRQAEPEPQEEEPEESLIRTEDEDDDEMEDNIKTVKKSRQKLDLIDLYKKECERVLREVGC